MLGPDTFLPRSRDDDGGLRHITARDVNWAHAYATSFPERRRSLVDRVWLGATASLVLAASIPLLGHWLFGWSVPWMLIALGIDLLALWLADLVRQHADAGAFDEAIAELVSRRHAVATARALRGGRRGAPRLAGPDPLRDNARFIRLSNWFAPYPLLVVIPLVAGWHFAPRQDWGTLQFALLLSPFLVRPLEALLVARRVRDGREGAASLLPLAPMGIARTLAAATIFLWLARFAVDVHGNAFFNRYGGIAALVMLAASSIVFALLAQHRNHRDATLLRQFAAQDRATLVARVEGS